MIYKRAAQLAVPVLTAAFLIQVGVSVLRQPAVIWNEIRLARSIALSHRYPLYPGQRDTGPIVGTMHTPVSQLLYRTAAGWKHPTQGILAGSLLSVTLVFGSILWILTRTKPSAPEQWAIGAFAVLYCGFGILQSPGMYYAVMSVHTDAAALSFATIGCALLFRRSTSTALWLSAVCMVLCVWSKQTMTPVVAAAALFLWLTYGFAYSAKYVLRVVICFVLVALCTVALFPSDAFWFNTVTLAAHRPYRAPVLPYMVELFRAIKQDSLTAIVPIVFFLFFEWRRSPKFRDLIRDNRWLIFLFAGVSLLPGTIKATATVGGDINHIGLVLFFWFIAAGVLLQHRMAASDSFLRPSAWLFAAVAILVSVNPGAVFALPSTIHELWENPSERAFTYASRHPNQAYFPWNPAAALLASGALYHFDMALYDREIAGYPLTEEQLVSGLPKQFQLVAIPPGLQIQSRALEHAFASFKPTTDPELPGWTVLARP